MGELRWFRLRRESRLLCSPLDSRERKVNGLTRSMKSIPTDKKTIAVTINGLCRPWLKSASKVLTPSSQLWWIWKPISDVYEFICIHCFLKARKERGLTPDLPPGPLCVRKPGQATRQQCAKMIAFPLSYFYPWLFPSNLCQTEKFLGFF